MKKKSIVRKLIITFTSITGGVLTLVGLIITFLVNIGYNTQIIETLNKQLIIVENGIEAYLNQEENGYDQLDKILKMSSLSTNMDAILVDKLGYIYMVSNEKHQDLKYTKLDMDSKIQEEIDNLKNKDSVSKVYSKGKLQAYIKPIYSKDEMDGYIIMISNEYYPGKHMMLIIWVSVICAMVIAGLIVNYFAKRFVVKPLEELNNAAQKLAKGEVEKRVVVRSADEIGQLAESFNSMAEALQTVDTTRRDFISNVSHELRSPITSIKGFVNGLLDGVIPKDKENYYLNIVFEEVNRLARLVNDLLDISAMEAGKFNLQKIEFDINSVVSLCIMNSESKIKDKGLDVKAVFDEKRYFVIGDRDRIIQVVTNLVENAIKYSNDGGKIKITTFSKGEKIYVSIFNTGELIPKNDLNNIWERFYKSDKSRTNKISTGLGLPVVRLILSQHNEDVWVRNIEDKGVEFTFSLTKSNK